MSNHLKTSDHAAWITIIARLGFIAKGMIYFSIGLLAFQIAIGIGGETFGATEILKDFIYKPFGTALLIFFLPGSLPMPHGRSSMDRLMLKI